MPQLIDTPHRIPVPGGKIIEEYVGRVATRTEGVSVARMTAPGGWDEPAQAPEFDEVTVVLRGVVRVEHDGGVGADYVAVCLPAFAPDLVHREDDEAR